MNKLVIKEIKTNKPCGYRDCENKAENCLKLKKTEKILLCEKCFVKFFKECTTNYEKENGDCE